MKASLTEFITKRVNRPNEQEIEEILGIFEMRNVAKGTLLKKPDTVCDFLAFVVSGSVRAFVMKETGDEITEYVTLPNNIATDLISVRTGIPNAIAIDCLEDSTLLVAALADYFPLLDSNLTLNIIVRKHMADRAVELSQRHLLHLTGTSKERYQYVMENNPGLLERLPLHLIASMIGITPTQLSRIRSK